MRPSSRRPRPAAPAASRRRSTLLAALVGVAFIVGLLLWMRQGETAPPRPAPVAVRSDVAPSEPARPLAWEPKEPRPIDVEPLDEVEGLVPLIDEILVDRKEMCTNETALVSVKLRADAPAPVRVFVEGTSGNPVPVTYPAPGHKMLLVRVQAGLGDATDARRIALDVRDCGGRFQHVSVQAERKQGTGTSDVLRFVARPFFARPECTREGGAEAWRRCNAAPEPGETLEFRWDFADGSTQTTSSGYVEHDYSDRRQDEVESRLLVKVEVVSSESGALTGMVAVTLDNPSVENKLRNRVITPRAHAECEPWHEGRALRCDVTFRNPDSRTLSLQDVEATQSGCGDADPLPSSRGAARRLLSTAVVPPGVSHATLELPASEIGAKTCSIAFRAKGIAPDGFGVETIFGAVIHNPPTERLGPREAAADPEVAKRYGRVLKAMRALGREGGTITEEEIRELELQGKLQ